MNDMPFPRRFPWLPAMAILAFSGAFLLCHWLLWTPMQRYYLGTYLRCALLGTDPASSTEVRWLYKTGTKRETGIGYGCRRGSGNCGRRPWNPDAAFARGAAGRLDRLLQGPDEWLQTVRLQPFLQAQFYDGKSFWRLLLTPLLWGAAMFLFLLGRKYIAEPERI